MTKAIPNGKMVTFVGRFLINLTLFNTVYYNHKFMMKVIKFHTPKFESQRRGEMCHFGRRTK